MTGDGCCPARVTDILTRYLKQRCAEAARVETRFAGEVAHAVADLVLRGGKRLRPAFLCFGWQAATPGTCEIPAPILHAAAALELIQACALIHDDVMDGSALRRGGLSFHEAAAQRHRAGARRGDAAAFGASAALLAGDLALVWADDLWETSGVGTIARRRAHPVWRAMRTEMVAGQYLDLCGQPTEAQDPEAALRVAHLKSGSYTIERPLLLGAALAGAGKRAVTALRRAGRAAGVAFQLRDDLLGVFGDPRRTGKPAGEDIRHGKCTYLMALGLQRTRDKHLPALTQCLQTALGNPHLTDQDMQNVRTALTEVGAHSAVEARIDELVDAALAALDEPTLTSHATHDIKELMRTVAAIPA
jgi:geranylgeranyl diphosphate synthase type I